MKSSYAVLSNETEMLQRRAFQLQQELTELNMLYDCTQDKHLLSLYKKAKKQYDTLSKQIVRNQQKLKQM